MKMKRTFAGLLAVLLLLAVFSGCDGGTRPSSSAPDTQGSGDSTPSSVSQSKEPEEEPYVVNVMNIHSAKTEDCEEVSAYISSLTRDLIGAEVQIIPGITSEQINLALTSGEKMDILGVFSWISPLSSLVANGQLLPMTGLLEEYGQETLGMISEADWKCVTFNGEIYGVPMNKDKAQSKALQMSKKYVDQLGIDPTTIHTMDDVEEVLRKVKAELPDVYPLVSNGGGSIIHMIPVDDLGDGLGVIVDATKGDTTVVNLYETAEYKEFADRMHRWAQEGLIMPDASSNTSSIEQHLGAGTGFAGFVTSKPGAVLQASREASADLVQSQIVEPFSTTTMVACPYSIAASCENPEKAMQVLNLMYTNADISNAFIYGLEGKHYQWIDKENNVVDYADGVTTENTGYSVLGWAWPNQQVGAIWNGDDLDIWDQLSEFNATAAASPAKGFVWDNSSVLNEITACQNVVTKYQTGLESGILDPDETLAQMNRELKDAGLDTIIAEKQKQLDTWLASQE